MKRKVYSLITALGAILLCILFCITLALFIPYFTVYSADNFIDGVCRNINEDKLEEEIKALLSTNIETYAHDANIVTAVLDKHELKQTASDYFKKYYNAFINGEDTLPKIKYRNNNFYYAIKENAHLSQRPEYFEIDENSLLLATKCNNLVENYINSLSIDSAYSLLTSYRSSYFKLTEIGAYFQPLAASSAFVFIILLVFIIIQKRRKALYILTLALFSISALFAVPFIYIGEADLPSKLNISAGASYSYIDAVYRFIFTDTSYVYIALSAILLICFIASIIWNIKAKTK
ncbi:MAG: hypothetical protein E7635_01890 [Ruminococcaceae bacterium]|nr:hypothetical protein [Oscillospiraceae bacterium]